MLGQQTQPMELKYHRLEVSYRWILAVALIALIALAGLVVWTAVNRLGLPNGEAAAQDLTAAWSNTDSSLLGTVYAEDAVVVTAGGITYEGLTAIKGLHATMAGFSFTPTIIGPVVQTERTVVVPYRLTWSTGDVAYVTTILELNSSGLIVHHQDYGTP